jgi:hypothetical protein
MPILPQAKSRRQRLQQWRKHNDKDIELESAALEAAAVHRYDPHFERFTDSCVPGCNRPLYPGRAIHGINAYTGNRGILAKQDLDQRIGARQLLVYADPRDVTVLISHRDWPASGRKRAPLIGR